MKIRTDFVTNSSSVSYIISMKLDIVDAFISFHDNIDSMQGELRMAKALRDFMIEEGTLTYLHEFEIYTYLMTFSDDDGTAVTKEMLDNDGKTSNTLRMNREELFNFIRGEIIHKNKINWFLDGFGATQVKHY